MTVRTTRRQFLGQATAIAAGLSVATPCLSTMAMEPAAPAPPSVPRWRGFNLLDFFQAMWRPAEGDFVKVSAVPEEDCQLIAELGFDFVRLPTDYWLWIDSDWPKTKKLNPDDMFKIREATLEKIDQSIETCRKYGLHVNFNLHRAPGYCINDPEREPLSLWKDKVAQEAFVHHWELFAKRYRGIPAKELSFNLVNEAPGPRPGYMTAEDYCRIMGQAIEVIRKISPDRLIFVDG